MLLFVCLPVTLPQHKERSLALASEEEEPEVWTNAAPYETVHHFAPPDSSQPTPDQLVPEGGNSSSIRAGSQELDFDALRAAISQFKAAKASKDWTTQGPFNLNTHQSFLGVGLPPAPCINALEGADSPTSSSLALHARQPSESQVGSPLKLHHPTHRRGSQEDLRLSQQVQETTVTTSSLDSSSPTSLGGHTDTNCRDSSSGVESAMFSHLLSCDDNVERFGTRGQKDRTKMPIFSQSETVSGVPPQEHKSALPSGTSATTFEGLIQTSEANSSRANHLNSSSGTVSHTTGVEDAETAPTSLPTPVSKTASNHQLVKPPVPSLHSKQPETPTFLPGLLQLPTAASFNRESAGMWSCPQGPLAMSNRGHDLNATATDPRAAMMLRHVMGNTFGNRLGGVGPHGGLLPMPGVPMAWNGYPRGGGSVGMWGMQQGLQLRQMQQQTQYLQGLTWRGDFPGQGRGYRPFGGDYNSF